MFLLRVINRRCLCAGKDGLSCDQEQLLKLRSGATKRLIYRLATWLMMLFVVVRENDRNTDMRVRLKLSKREILFGWWELARIRSQVKVAK